MVKNKTPTGRTVRRVDSIRLDAEDSTYFTEEGYLVDHPILTSVGIFEYKDPKAKDGVRRELRLPEYVFEKESLDSYKSKPIVITHRGGEVDKNNVGQRQIGTIMSEGYQDGDDVRAEIIIHDTDAMERSGLKELSLGYTLDLVEEPGTYNGQHYDGIQTNIRVNHLALVGTARAGESARLNIDGRDDEDIETLEGGRVMKRRIVRNDSKAMTPDELMGAIGKLVEQFTGGGEDEDAESKEAPVETAKTAPVPKAAPKAVPKQEDDDDEEAAPVPVPAKAPAPAKALAAPVVEEDKEQTDGDALGEFLTALEALIAKYKGTEENTDADDVQPELGTPENPIIDPETDEDEGEDEEGGETFTLAELMEEDEADVADTQAAGATEPTKVLNTDSADIFEQKVELEILGRQLGISGLRNKSVREGKKAIIDKVKPGLRLDGKSDDYVNAVFDMAKASIEKHAQGKGIEYQRRQMESGNMRMNMDGREKSLAQSARENMIERQGGR